MRLLKKKYLLTMATFLITISLIVTYYMYSAKVNRIPKSATLVKNISRDIYE